MTRAAVRRIVLVLATVSVLGGCSSAPPPAPAPVDPIAPCVDEADQRANGATLTRPDGTTVAALVHGSGRTAIVFANQVDLDVCEWQPYEQILADKGYLTVLFEYSGAPGAEQDVLAAAATARQRGATAVLLVGASKGGTAVLAAAAVARPAVAGVVSLSAPEGYPGVGPVGMARFTTPVLFVAGDNDGEFTDSARHLYATCAATDKRLVLRPNGFHGTALLDQQVFALVGDFLASHAAR